METTKLKKYIGTKEVMAAPMDEATAVAKGFARKTRIIMSGDLAITSSTLTQMAAPTIHGPLRMCSKSHTR